MTKNHEKTEINKVKNLVEKYPNRITGIPGRLFYIKKKEAYASEWEGEWDRIQRKRKENDPLMLGGQFRKFEKQNPNWIATLSRYARSKK